MISPKKGWRVDHIEPIQRNWWKDGKGVVSSLHPERDIEINQVPCCASCNIQKGSLTLEQFRDKIMHFVYSLNHYHTQYAVAKRYGLVQDLEIPVKFWFEKAAEGEKVQ